MFMRQAFRDTWAERQQDFWMSQMKIKILIPAIIALMGVSAGAWADDQDDDGEVTISLMPAGADVPEAVTKRIELPTLEMGNEQADEKVKRARQALTKAEQKRTEGRDHGRSQADLARDKAQEMSENAKDKNENRGRAEGRPDRPDPPGPPDNPPGRN